MAATERIYVDGAGSTIELRQEGDGPTKIVGRAAVFYEDGDPGTEYQLWTGAVERILPRAFNRALKEKQDVFALINHDPNQVLGRTSAGTLKLTRSAEGLEYEIDPPDTELARALVENIRRGNITGSSFGFRVIDEKVIRGKGGAPDVREIRDVDLVDVSPVTFPAYKSTTAGLRQADCPVEVRAQIEQQQADEQEAAAKLAAKIAERRKYLDDRRGQLEGRCES